MESQWNIFIQQVTNLSESDQDCLFDLILTQDEKQAILTRLSVFRALLKGDRSHREISKDLSVSIATITRCSNYLKNMPDSVLQQVKALALKDSLLVD